MTRFLSRLLEDPQSGGLNNETERLFAYHQATKHTYHSVRTSAHYLDWSNQPDPFRTYEGAPTIVLPPDPGFPDTGTFAAMEALAEGAEISTGNKPGDGQQVRLDNIWLSRLLWHSMAVSAWKKVANTGNRYSLRVNPSSGNLHPTETYLAVRDFTGIDNGLYHYRADRHALELRSPGPWPQQLARKLMVPRAEQSPLIIALTSIFWREAWKYRDRAYRYCCHDLGHAMMSLLLAAQALGLPGGVITHFGDARLTRALGLTGGDEAPMAFLVFPPRNASAISHSLPKEIFAGIPSELSAEEKPYELLLEVHRSTLLPDSPGPPPILPLEDSVMPGVHAVQSEPSRDARLGATVRRRRSALDFDPRTIPMERAEVEQLLDFATRDWRADWRGNFDGQKSERDAGADFVTLYLYIHRVRDCEAGVYRWNRVTCSLDQLHRGNVQRMAAFLSLEQALAGNSCFSVSMIADLARAAELFGNRGYRYVHFEAGAIGQRLYLGAEALNWNATGIGAFYDDDVHRYLGFLEERDEPVAASLDAAERAAIVMLDSPASRPATAQSASGSSSGSSGLSSEAAPLKDARTLPRQVIYHFAVGRAIPDPRLEA